MTNINEAICQLAIITCGAVIQTLYIVIAANTVGKVRQESIKSANAYRDQYLEVCNALKESER